MIRAAATAAIAAALVLGSIVSASAQVWRGSSEVPRRGSWELGGGVVWAGGFEVDSLPANLTANAGNDAPPFTLFTSDWEVKPVVGFQGRAAVYLSPSVAVEGGVQYSRPIVSVRISGDAEDADDVTADEKMSRYIFDGTVLFHLTKLGFAGRRGLPFLSAGAGYLRELHEGNELVETGTEYHAGGGVKIWFGQGRRRTGIRADFGVSIRDGGYAGEEGTRTLPTAGASFVYLF